MDRSERVMHVPSNPGTVDFSWRDCGPCGAELGRMESLWSAAAAILGSENRLWSQRPSPDFRNGQISPIDAAQAGDEGLSDALAYLEQSRKRLLDWGWTGGPTPWRTKPRRRQPKTWTWTKRPPPP